MNVGDLTTRSRGLRRGVLACALLATAAVVPAQSVDVRAVREGSLVRLRATVHFTASPAVVWSVLTDYEGQGRFVPGIVESRLLSRDSSGSVVRQRGSVAVLFFRFPFDVVYATVEQPPTALTARLVRGSVRRMQSTYHLSPDGAGTLLEYRGEVEVSGWLPPLIGPAIVRGQVESQLKAIAAEIDRRARERRPP